MNEKDTFIGKFKMLHNATASNISNIDLYDCISKTEYYRKSIENGGILVVDMSEIEDANLRTNLDVMIREEIASGKDPGYINELLRGNYKILGVIKEIDAVQETVKVEIPISNRDGLIKYLFSIPKKELDTRGQISFLISCSKFNDNNGSIDITIDDNSYIVYARFL